MNLSSTGVYEVDEGVEKQIDFDKIEDEIRYATE